MGRVVGGSGEEEEKESGTWLGVALLFCRVGFQFSYIPVSSLPGDFKGTFS